MANNSASRHHLLAEWYRNHHGWLVGWLKRKLEGAAHADDLAQEAFVRLFKAPQLEDVCEPRAFLTVVAKRELYNFWRRRELEQAYLDALAQMPEEFGLSQEEPSSNRRSGEQHGYGVQRAVEHLFADRDRHECRKRT